MHPHMRCSPSTTTKCGFFLRSDSCQGLPVQFFDSTKRSNYGTTKIQNIRFRTALQYCRVILLRHLAVSSCRVILPCHLAVRAPLSELTGRRRSRRMIESLTPLKDLRANLGVFPRDRDQRLFPIYLNLNQHFSSARESIRQ